MTAIPRIDGGPRRWVFQDWAVNAGCRDAQLVLVLVRAAQWARHRGTVPGRVFCAVYGLLSSLLLKVDIPPEVRIGPRLRVFHPGGIVLHPEVVLGADCTLRHHVTLGNVVRRDGTSKGTPTLGDRVELGAGSAVLGGVRVGDDARIGALALVLDDVPACGVAVGNPARTVRIDRPSVLREVT